MVLISPIAMDQVEPVARLHREVFQGSMNVRLGRSYVRALVAWFACDSNRIALAATDEQNQLLGYVLGVAHTELHRMTKDLLVPAAIGLGVKPWLLFDREFRHVCFGRLSRIGQSMDREEALQSLPEPLVSLVGIGVASNARGQHVGKRLTAAFEERAAAMGAKSLELTVRRQNEPAIRLYRACGWREASGAGELPVTIRFVKVP